MVLSFFALYWYYPIKTGEELVYYHLYHEEASFYPDFCPQLSNGTYIKDIKLTITYNDSTYLVFVPLLKIMLTDKKSLKLIEWIMIKYIHKYNYHNCFVHK